MLGKQLKATTLYLRNTTKLLSAANRIKARMRSSVVTAFALVSLSFPTYYSNALLVPCQSSTSQGRRIPTSMHLCRDDDNEVNSRQNKNFPATAASLAVAMSLCFAPFASEPALANSYGSFTPEQKMVTEAWRARLQPPSGAVRIRNLTSASASVFRSVHPAACLPPSRW